MSPLRTLLLALLVALGALGGMAALGHLLAAVLP
jgi:hypothetical protein